MRKMAEMKKVQKISVLACTLLMLSGVTNAAGLGKLSIQSALGQPLRAEIELLSVSKDELASINAKLASHESFRLARIDRPEALNNLRMSVDQRANGQPVVRLTSTSAINDPFLDVLIELSWSSGRIIREYTVLLDPPGQGKQASESVSLPTEATRVPVAPKATETPKAAPVEPTVITPKPAPAKLAVDRYGPVKSGETLRAIAGQLKPAKLSVEQMMVALYQDNKASFFDGNMNNLKKGAVLNVPSEDSVASIERATAQKTLGEHLTAWHAYRSKMADEAATSPQAKTPAQTSTGKIMPKASEVAPPAAGSSKDVLKLSKGEPAANAKAAEKMRAMEEELAAKARSLQEAQSRVAHLEKTVSDMQKLMDMKAKAPPPAPVPVPTPQPKPVVQAPPPAPVASVPAAQPAPTAAPVPAPAPSAVAKPVAESKPPVELPAVVEPTKKDKGWISTFITDPLYVGGLVAALLLSALLWMMMVGNRRRQGLNKFEDSIMTGGEFKNASVFNAPTGVGTGATTGGSMLLTDFSRLGLGAIDTHEVDPIAEAEVYMAYGRDAQAEEILKEALAKDPTRHEIALKLLEIFAARKDTVAFETAASELYAGLGGQNTPVWQRAAEMGRSIDPTNPLYRLTTGDLGASQSFAPAPAPVAEVVAPLEPAVEEVAKVVGLDEGLVEMPVEHPFEPAMAEESMEFEPEPAFEPMAIEPMEEDLTAISLSEHDEGQVPEPVMALDMAEDELAEAVEFEAVSAEELPEVDLSSIDLELAEPATVAESAPVSFAEPEQPIEDVSLEDEFEPVEVEGVAEFIPDEVVEEIPAVVEAEEAVEPADFSDEPSNLWEEVNTKLDLARAYLEMGDKEGAREILQEVMGEGDVNQKGEAEKLLSEAG